MSGDEARRRGRSGIALVAVRASRSVCCPRGRRSGPSAVKKLSPRGGSAAASAFFVAAVADSRDIPSPARPRAARGEAEADAARGESPPSRPWIRLALALSPRVVAGRELRNRCWRIVLGTVREPILGEMGRANGAIGRCIAGSTARPDMGLTGRRSATRASIADLFGERPTVSSASQPFHEDASCFGLR